MNVAFMAASAGLGLAVLTLVLFSIIHTRTLLRKAERRRAQERAESQSALESLRKSTGALEAALQEVQRQRPPEPGPIRQGFNLSKRSQALRMHRRGEPTSQIAAALDISLQEVELLLKVHQIVIRNI